MRTTIVLSLVLLAAPACAGLPNRPDPLAESQGRGEALAKQVCAACHAVAAAGDSPDRRAPPFRTLSGAYVPLTLQRKLTDIAESGHYAMPAVKVDSDQVNDLAAYINSLKTP